MKILLILIIPLSIFSQDTTYVSYYGDAFCGKQTANGEVFDIFKYTAASPSLPFNTKLKVTNIENNNWVIVRVNDRGPFTMTKTGQPVYPLRPHPIRSLDLSKASFKCIAPLSLGVIKVKIEIIN